MSIPKVAVYSVARDKFEAFETAGHAALWLWGKDLRKYRVFVHAGQGPPEVGNLEAWIKDKLNTLEVKPDAPAPRDEQDHGDPADVAARLRFADGGGIGDP